jgi:predicted membrane protein
VAAPGLPDAEVDTEVHSDIGNVTVLVPEDADVTVSCATDLGNLVCLDQTLSAPEARIDEYTDFGADGAGGLKIVLSATTDTGNVEVRRG